MKILKVFGFVVAIHLSALILLFAIPGCSSTSKTPPSPGETAAKPTSPAAASTATPSITPAATREAGPSSSAITFNPNVPAAPAPAASAGDRYSPTRPGTPVAGALLVEPVTDVTPASTYIVKANDNLWTIARKNNITLAQLTAANGLSANASLKPGQKLIIPAQTGSGVSSGSLSAASASGAKAVDPSAGISVTRAGAEGLKHVVKSGETLGSIARRYEVRSADVALANNISDPAKIRPGMELIIPGWQPPAKSGKATKSTNGKSAPATLPALSEPPPTPAPTTAPAVPVIRIDDAPPPAK